MWSRDRLKKEAKKVLSNRLSSTPGILQELTTGAHWETFLNKGTERIRLAQLELPAMAMKEGLSVGESTWTRFAETLAVHYARKRLDQMESKMTKDQRAIENYVKEKAQNDLNDRLEADFNRVQSKDHSVPVSGTEGHP
jgi:hypothetical protein